MPISSAQENPTPPAESVLIPAHLLDAPNQISEAYCSCPPFLHSPRTLGFMYIMGAHRSARQLLLKHLLQIVLVILVSEVEMVFAIL